MGEGGARARDRRRSVGRLVASAPPHAARDPEGEGNKLSPRILNCTVIDKMAVQFFAALWAWGKSLQDGGAQTAFWGKAP